MTRPTDASIAVAFWRVSGYIDLSDSDTRLLQIVVAEAMKDDAESPAGTKQSPFLQGTGCAPMPGPILHTIPEKVTTSPERVQIPAESKRVCTVSTCRAEMRPGLRCSSLHCGLKEATT